MSVNWWQIGGLFTSGKRQVSLFEWGAMRIASLLLPETKPFVDARRQSKILTAAAPVQATSRGAVFRLRSTAHVEHERGETRLCESPPRSE